MHTTAAKFRRRVEQTISSAADAIKFLQRQHSVNYAAQSRKVDSGDEDAPDRVMPTFFLDFLAILGKPSEAVSKATDSHPLSSISISFKDWAAPYSGKHLNAALSFGLTGRTFKIGADGLGMTWFIVVAPDPRGATFGDGRREDEEEDTNSEPDRPTGRSERQNGRGNGPGERAKTKGTALKSWRAKRFIEYFHKYVSSTILGRGIEESWRLWSQETAQISLTDWAALQRALVSGWDESVVEMSVRDRFWAGTQLAFHAYGYGGNVSIEVGSGPPVPELEKTRRDDDDDDNNDNDNNNDYDNDDEGDGNDNRGEGNVYDDGNVSGMQDDIATAHGNSPAGSQRESARSQDGHERGTGASSIPPTNLHRGPTAPERDPDGGAARLIHYAETAPGLRRLGLTIDAIFDLNAIDNIAYALAADINCLGNGEPSCLLADFKEVDDQYKDRKLANLTHYSLGFTPRHGNFTSSLPPDFVDNVLRTVCSNMSCENDNADIVTPGYFQGYSNIKKTAIATAALSLPASGPGITPAAKKTQQKLLDQLAGENSPEARFRTIPFAREASRLEQCIEEGECAFRMEQVITVSVSQLLPERRSMPMVLRPMTQLISFFLTAQKEYTQVLRVFDPEAFPGVLCAYARLFELIAASMLAQFKRGGKAGLTVELGEAMAAVDRLGSFCFTGDKRVLPSTTFRYLGTMESIKNHAFPYIDPGRLNMAGQGRMNLMNWPGVQKRRVHLLQAASLQYHYGKQVAAGRESEARVQLLSQDAYAATEYIEEVFRNHFVPEMRQFFAGRVRKLLQKRGRSVELSDEQRGKLRKGRLCLDDWEAAGQNGTAAFSSESFSSIVAEINDALDEGQGQRKEAITSDKLEQDRYVDHILEALQSSSGNAMDRNLSSKNMTWLAILSSLYKQTYNKGSPEKSAGQWRYHIGSALRRNRVEWVLGSSRGTITVTMAQRVLPSMEKSSLAGWAMDLYPGTLKRKAVESEIAREGKRRNARQSCIDFGCKFPLSGGLPAELERGFKQLLENSGHMKAPHAGLTNHYKKAHRLLEELQGRPEVELLCMLALTVGMTSDMVVYNVPRGRGGNEVVGFAIADKKVKQKRGGTRAALLAIRMLWFLEPDQFVWNKAQGLERKVEEATMYSTQHVREATDQYKITNNMLATLGWIDSRGNQLNARSDMLRIASQETLRARLRLLRSLMSRPADFVREVFESDDPKWVDQCRAIIK
ncbi:hypothetical protein ACQKWADRAFT_317160 [Trichoderma austrokoningii]